MIKEATKKYANISIEALELFKELCEECQLKKRKLASKGLVKSIVSKEFNSRGQMDLIDMQSLSYNDYRYIMVYQDHMTKCVVKRTPYKVMFGVEAKVGLTSSSLPDAIISKIITEDDLKDSTNTGFRNDFDIIEITDEVSGTGNTDSVTCIVCQKPASNAHSCSKCSNTVHVICGKTDGEEGFGRSVLCFLCFNEKQIELERSNATVCTEKQAERMLSRSNNILEEFDIGCNVLIPIPQVDRSKGDPKNIMAIVHEKTDKGYSLATKHGILLGSYTRNQFELTDSLFLRPSDISIENFISLRRAVKVDSLFEGQGFLKCGCCGKNRCETNRCACRKAGQMCNSRCHPNLACKNK
jgi:hypothetical protein